MNTQTKISVVAVLLLHPQDPNSFYIALRPDGSGWEFPGGKVELLETMSDALVREIREELQIEILVGSRVARSDVLVGNRRIQMDLFVGNWVSGNLELIEHLDGRWITKDELYEFEWAPADIPLLGSVYNFFSDDLG